MTPAEPEPDAPDARTLPEEAVAGAEDAGTFRLGELVGSTLRLAAQGRHVARTATELSRETARIVRGSSEVVAPKGDWRFTDPTWERNPAYRRFKQLYLAWSDGLLGLAGEAVVEWRSRERARL